MGRPGKLPGERSCWGRLGVKDPLGVARFGEESGVLVWESIGRGGCTGLVLPSLGRKPPEENAAGDIGGLWKPFRDVFE